MTPRVVFAVTAARALGVIVGHVDYLTSLGWDVHIVVGVEVDPAMFPKATLHEVPMRREPAPLADTKALREWVTLMRRLRPTVVVGATPKAALLSLTAARIAGVPHRIWWVWGLRTTPESSRIVRAAELGADRVATHSVAASESLAEAVVAAGVRRRPTVLGDGAIGGVDLDVFHPRDADPGPVAAYVGLFSAAKGMAELAEVWGRVVTRLPEARLLMVGAGDDLDPATESLAKLASLPGVQWRGYSDDVATELAGASVLVMPSAREGLPAVVLEASACGLPTVAWDVTGTRDAVDDGVTGRLLPPGDVAAMTEAVVELLADYGAACRLGLGARAMVAERFDRNLVEELFARYLQEIAGSAAPAPARDQDPWSIEDAEINLRGEDLSDAPVRLP